MLSPAAALTTRMSGGFTAEAEVWSRGVGRTVPPGGSVPAPGGCQHPCLVLASRLPSRPASPHLSWPRLPGLLLRMCQSPSAPSWDSCDRVQGPQIIRDKLPSQDSRLNHTHHTREDVQARHLDLAVSEATVQPRTGSLGTPQEGHPKAPERQRLLRRGQNWGSTRQRAALVSRTGVWGEMQNSWCTQPARCDCWLGGEGRPGVQRAVCQ